MSDKLNCSILNCASFIDSKNVVYFRYPLENKDLLKKWLNQINRPNWQPMKGDVICSRHFKISDINDHLNKTTANLKPMAVPTIFPNKTISLNNPNERMLSSKVQLLPTIRSNTIVRKQINANSPGSTVLVPVNKPNSQSSVISKPMPVVVSKAKSTGMTIVKPQMSPLIQKGTPGRKRKVIEVTKEFNEDRKNREAEKDRVTSVAKKPVLRICVNKKYKQTKNGAIKDRNKEAREEDRSKEMTNQLEIDTVIFKLDPVTREIIVLKKTTDESKESHQATQVKQPR